jgi:uncharacterized membrane protein
LSTFIKTPETSVPTSDRRAYRLPSIDALCRLVMVIMALDHLLDFVMAGSLQDLRSDPRR